jgi:hypothetical protein
MTPLLERRKLNDLSPARDLGPSAQVKDLGARSAPQVNKPTALPLPLCPLRPRPIRANHLRKSSFQVKPWRDDASHTSQRAMSFTPQLTWGLNAIEYISLVRGLEFSPGEALREESFNYPCANQCLVRD